MNTLFSLIVLQAFAAQPDALPYEIHEKQLDNGLTVIVIPLNTPNVAQVRTWMAVGSRDELDPGRTGFAHFFEHLMFFLHWEDFWASPLQSQQRQVVSPHSLDQRRWLH